MCRVTMTADIFYWIGMPLAGLLAGSLAGMFGIGGGLIVVPALSYLFVLHDPDGGFRMHTAVGTSLAGIVLTSLPAVRTHHNAGFVEWPTAAALAPAMMVGSLLGAATAAALSGATLRNLIGILIIVTAIYVFADRKPEASRPLPGAAGLSGFGSIIGLVSALAGIGGGLLTTPFLLWHGRNIRYAIGTAAACTIPVALAGAVGFVVTGWPDGDGLEFSTGYVYWPAVAGIASGSMLGAVAGARLGHRTAAPVLRRMFAILLAGAGLDMVA